jgi:DNA-binding response OmpR family regulator
MGIAQMPVGKVAKDGLSASDLLTNKIEELRTTIAQMQNLIMQLAPSAEDAVQKIGLEESVRSVVVGNQRIYLTEQQMFLFKLLLNADRPLSNENILEAMYPPGTRPAGNNIVAVVMSNLRKKLRTACGGRDPIETRRGVGFILHRDLLAMATGEHQPVENDWRRPKRAKARSTQ